VYFLHYFGLSQSATKKEPGLRESAMIPLLVYKNLHLLGVRYLCGVGRTHPTANPGDNSSAGFLQQARGHHAWDWDGAGAVGGLGCWHVWDFGMAGMGLGKSSGSC
jgi:hypothetical protein